MSKPRNHNRPRLPFPELFFPFCPRSCQLTKPRELPAQSQVILVNRANPLSQWSRSPEFLRRVPRPQATPSPYGRSRVTHTKSRARNRPQRRRVRSKSVRGSTSPARSTAASTSRELNPEKLEIVARRNGFARWLAKPPKKFEVPHARVVLKPNPVDGRLDIFPQLAIPTILRKPSRNSASEIQPGTPLPRWVEGYRIPSHCAAWNYSNFGNVIPGFAP